MFFIYKATNSVNKKAYIGFTSSLEDRKKEHYCEAFTRNSQFLFHKALRKYGWEAFIWEVLDQNEDQEYLLKTREGQLIQLEQTHFQNGHGYNMTLGGDGITGFRFTEEQREKLRISHLGKRHSETTKTKLSIAHLGRKNTTNHNQNISKAFSKEWSVVRPDGAEVRVVNLKEFCRVEGLRYSGMHKVAIGVTKHHRGYSVKPAQE